MDVRSYVRLDRGSDQMWDQKLLIADNLSFDIENFLFVQVDQRFDLLLPHLLAFWAPEKKRKKEEKLGHVSRERPPSLRLAIFYF